MTQPDRDSHWQHPMVRERGPHTGLIAYGYNSVSDVDDWIDRHRQKPLLDPEHRLMMAILEYAIEEANYKDGFNVQALDAQQLPGQTGKKPRASARVDRATRYGQVLLGVFLRLGVRLPGARSFGDPKALDESLRMRRFFRRLLGLNECGNCGVVTTQWGSIVRTAKGFEYHCERCFNLEMESDV